MIKNEEIKNLVEEAVIAASAAEKQHNEEYPNPNDAQVTALVSIAKSLAAIAGIMEKVTNGNAVINVYDTSGPIL